MVEKTETFADRFIQLKGPRSYEALADEIEHATGVRISPQAMHKWGAQNGGITLENARVVAAFFRVSPAWLLFGEGPQDRREHLETVLQELSDESRQQVFDFISYKFEKADGLFASDKLGDYLGMIRRIKDDIKRRRGER